MTKPTIVLPEGNDERVRLAAKTLLDEQVCKLVLIGDQKAITEELGDSTEYTVLESDSKELESLKAEAVQKGKVFPVADAALVQGAALVRDNAAEGIVAGAVAETDDVFRVYLKTIGVRTDVSRVTSCFLMEKGGERVIFADCGLNPTSDALQLAETASLSAEFAQLIDLNPKVGFLSFQTTPKAAHSSLEWIHEAVRVARETYGLECDGPLQFDSAFIPKVATVKTPDSTVAGTVNIFLFPDLNSGNIGYKIAERMGGYKATGPLFLGFAKPAHDLSRGCLVIDVVNAVKVAVKQLEKA